MDAPEEFNPQGFDTVLKAGFVVYRRLPPQNKIEFLLMRSATGKQSWGPPKGHTEANESEYQTACREMNEETGLKERDVKVTPDLKYEIRYTKHYNKSQGQSRCYYNKMVIVNLWLAELIDPHCKIILSEEHQDFKWTPLEETKELIKTRSGFQLFVNCFEKCEKIIQEFY